MLHIKSLDEGLELFKALGSDVRVEIIKILLNENAMNMNELASRLNITNGALTSHIKKLEECGAANNAGALKESEQAQLKALSEAFEKNHEKWENDIVAAITGQG